LQGRLKSLQSLQQAFRLFLGQASPWLNKEREFVKVFQRRVEGVEGVLDDVPQREEGREIVHASPLELQKLRQHPIEQCPLCPVNQAICGVVLVPILNESEVAQNNPPKEQKRKDEDVEKKGQG